MRQLTNRKFQAGQECPGSEFAFGYVVRI